MKAAWRPFSGRIVSFPVPIERDWVGPASALAGIALVAAGGWFVSVLGLGRPPNPKPANSTAMEQMRSEFLNRNRAQAYAASQSFVESRFRSLRSAAFPSMDDGLVTVKEVATDVWYVSGYLITHDEFGATKRPCFTAKLKQLHAGGWEVKSVSLSGSTETLVSNL